MVVCGGGPGRAGKDHAGAWAGARFRCLYLRVDAVETALQRTGLLVGPEGYAVVHELAVSNLLIGVPVVVGAVHPVPEARQGWAATAARANARLIVLETSLPDEREHRRRVQERTADIPGHQVPIWAEVQADGWVSWDEVRDGPRTIIDTTDSTTALGVGVDAIRQL